MLDCRSSSTHVDHPSQAKMGTRPFPDKLYVITPISNPKRYNARYEHYRAFEKRVRDAGAILYTIEAAFGDREFEVTSCDDPCHIQVRTAAEIWHKECLINLALHRLPHSAKYIAWVDADLTFSRPDWAQETIHQLQHYDIVQMFSDIIQLGPHSEVLNTGLSFMEGWRRGIAFQTSVGTAKDKTHYKKSGYGCAPKMGWCGAPGGAWASTRQCLDSIGGLLDFAILGSGDYHMALGLMGLMQFSFQANYHPAYLETLLTWQEQALRHIKKNVGIVSGTIMHHWHGKMSSRGYEDRWKILVKHQFNPLKHLKRDSFGLYRLSDECWELRDDIRSYFGQRNEDGIDK